MVKILWHDGIGMSLYVKWLDHGRFIWPSPVDGAVRVSAAQLGYLLDGSTGGTRGTRGGRPPPAERGCDFPPSHWLCG
jgi:transposase